MSEGTAELVRAAYEAWNDDGLEALAPVLAEDCELHDAPEMPDASVWRGKQAVLARLDEVAQAVGGGSVEFESVRALGDEVLVAMRWRLEHERAGAELGSVVHLVEVRDRAITAIRVFLDERRAAEAARSQSS
jgi:ketosteroid isomerase-like protein